WDINRSCCYWKSTAPDVLGAVAQRTLRGALSNSPSAVAKVRLPLEHQQTRRPTESRHLDRRCERRIGERPRRRVLRTSVRCNQPIGSTQGRKAAKAKWCRRHSRRRPLDLPC